MYIKIARYVYNYNYNNRIIITDCNVLCNRVHIDHLGNVYKNAVLVCQVQKIVANCHWEDQGSNVYFTLHKWCGNTQNELQMNVFFFLLKNPFYYVFFM
jgi:hypothetical protein